MRYKVCQLEDWRKSQWLCSTQGCGKPNYDLFRVLLEKGFGWQLHQLYMLSGRMSRKRKVYFEEGML